MITIIILIVFIILGIYIAHTSYKYELEGTFLTIIAGVLLLVHTPVLLIRSYQYEVMKTERGAFERTLNHSRENGNEYETAAIVKEIATWNQSLAVYKYQNKTLFLDQYIDDRVEDLEFIE